MTRSIAALAALLAFGIAACQPSNEKLEEIASKQQDMLAQLKTIEANQKRMLAAPTAAAARKAPTEDYNKVYKIDVSGSPFLGNPKASIAIVEYSDFQCPYCSRATPALKEVQKKYGDKVKLVFKHFPLSFHKSAKPAAVASMAAHEQGKFWEYHDALFKNQRALSPQNMEKYAQEAGLDVERFKKDLAAKRAEYTKAVDADFRQGQGIGVRGTPTVYIGGKKVANRTVAGMSAMIDAMLKEKGS